MTATMRALGLSRASAAGFYHLRQSRRNVPAVAELCCRRGDDLPHREAPALRSRTITLPPDAGLRTLPDLLGDGLEVVFVGINPSLFSVAQGHYFARRSNRFWPCFSASVLSRAARAALGVERLEPANDRLLLAHGFGFTDLAKRATAKASEVPPAEFAAGVAALVAKLERHRPRIACFHGITAWRPVHRALAGAGAEPSLGLQPAQLGRTCLFVVPSPSGANARFSRAEQTEWYDRLSRCLAELPRA
jgi:double-stranded uracil-DNA glycosylase